MEKNNPSGTFPGSNRKNLQRQCQFRLMGVLKGRYPALILQILISDHMSPSVPR